MKILRTEESRFNNLKDYNFKPNYLLEIGVYRGQIISLFELLVSSYSKEFEIWGISPLDNSSDSVSEYMDLDYHGDIKKNFDNF